MRRIAMAAPVARQTRHSAAACALFVGIFCFGPETAAQQAPDESKKNDITLPDVTVTQAQPASQPPNAQKKLRPRPTTNVAVTKPTPKAPEDEATSQAAATELPAAINGVTTSSAVRGNSGAPSAAIASVPGASAAGGQAATAIDMTRFDEVPVFSVTDVLHEVPGVSLKQGNGPRDMGISIRGSNARNGFGIRNIVILEDGFQVTQPDGLSRSDLIDPHAYAGIDVWRGPSSALFGNYATGGAINFRTYPGGAIDGAEYGIDVGSFNYLNNYAIGGKKGENWEASVFTSDVRGDGYYDYSAFNTQTVNALMTFRPSVSDTLTFKFINNTLDTELPFRMSLSQFNQNPFQKGCETAATAAAGCAITTFSATGNTAAGSADAVRQTAAQAGAGRDDRRTIGGFRWEHAFDADTSGQMQVVVDDRNINQPTGATSAIGDYLSYNVTAGLTKRVMVEGLPTLAHLTAFWNYLPVDGKTYNVAPGGDAKLGLLQSEQVGSTMNFGVRAREEVQLTEDVSVVAGANIESTNLDGKLTSYKYNTNGSTTSVSVVSAGRQITNIAPELGVVYVPTRDWQWRARVGTGYGTPQFSNLFVGPDGQPGNNAALKSQTNVGFDVGSDWTPAPGIVLSITGFYEFFRNEIVSQSPAGNSGSSFSFNAPASEHRGVELAADIALSPGWRLTASYLLNDQIYTDYTEILAKDPTPHDRSGNAIPGVSRNEITTRLSYDVPSGPLRGVGAFAEYEWHDGFFMENANLLKTPAYDVVNLNAHYATDVHWGAVKSLLTYFEIRNVFDTTYISAANNIADSLNTTQASLANVSGSIYAGNPRSYYGGIKLKF